MAEIISNCEAKELQESKENAANKTSRKARCGLQSEKSGLKRKDSVRIF